MITKMDKYSFIVFHSDLTPFLESLQGLGMVDITRDNKAVDTRSKELFDLSIRYNRIIKKLKSTIVESSDGDSSVKKSEESYFNEFSDLELLEKAELSFLNKEQWEQEGEQLRRELYDSSVWGALHKEDLEKIAALGYKIHLFSVSEKSFKPQWEQDYAIHILNEINGKIYFIILSYKDEEFQFEIPESKQPSMSFDIVEEKIAELKKIVSKNKNIGVIVMEPLRHEEPKDNFLKQVRKIADKINILKIAEEKEAGKYISRDLLAFPNLQATRNNYEQTKAGLPNLELSIRHLNRARELDNLAKAIVDYRQRMGVAKSPFSIRLEGYVKTNRNLGR